MEKAKKTKLIIGLLYLFLITVFLFLLFSKFSLTEIKSFTTYDFIKENRLYFLELKNSNFFLIFLIFLLFTILWVFPFLGFGFPIAIFGGFIFGKWIGTVVAVLGLSIGATFLYLFSNFFVYEYL